MPCATSAVCCCSERICTFVKCTYSTPKINTSVASKIAVPMIRNERKMRCVMV